MKREIDASASTKQHYVHVECMGIDDGSSVTVLSDHLDAFSYSKLEEEEEEASS